MKWILVDNKLPDKTDMYLVSRSEDCDYVDLCLYDNIRKEFGWLRRRWVTCPNIAAWAEILKPYRKEQEYE